MGRNITTAVIESLQYARPETLDSLLRQYSKVYIFEPRIAYHIQGRGIRFFPADQDGSLKGYQKDGRIQVLPAALFDPGKIYVDASEKAVASVEQAYPFYRKRHVPLIDSVCKLVRSPDAEYVFKKDLCDQLARYYSLNIYLEKVSAILVDTPFQVFPGMNALLYLSIHDLVKEAGLTHYAHAHDFFPVHVMHKSKCEARNLFYKTMIRCVFQTVATLVLSPFAHLCFALTRRRSYQYGMTVLGSRQLHDTHRNPFFIADEKNIHTFQIGIFPFSGPTRAAVLHNPLMKKNTVSMPWYAQYCYSGRLFRFVFFTIRSWSISGSRELKLAIHLLLHYAQWQCITKKVRMRHFITHSDFDMSHIGRGIALREQGVQTWYFTDSMNHGCDLRAPGQQGMRHPFWSYLTYDHFVTWSGLLASYFSDHPEPPKKTHVVGCLWSQHISKKEAVDQARVPFDLKRLKNVFTIAAFDTTYSRNGFFSYQEGIAFAEHLEALLEQHPDSIILLKEKKERVFHRAADPEYGPRLEEIYERLSAHPNSIICRNSVDAPDIISLADITVSMPFTSPTFEALSMNRPALWHDPFGRYRNTVYAAAGVTTHSFEELEEKITALKKIGSNAWNNPISLGSPLLDPFRDGKAIDRFRELLRTL